MRGGAKLRAIVAAAIGAVAVGDSGRGRFSTLEPTHRTLVATTTAHRISHVLLISVDGLHQSDLEWYVSQHPGSELAKLVHNGAEFSNAHTAVPSDSDPGGRR